MMRGSIQVIGIVSLVVYGYSVWLGQSDPRSATGIGFGIAAAAALGVVMAYSVRRSLPSARWLGRARPYLRLHLYAGLLFVALFLFHTDFGMPSGLLTGTLWFVTVWVVATGVLGAALQRWLPRILDDASSIEVQYDRIPELVEELSVRAERLAADADTRIRTFYDREMATEMAQVRSVTSVRPGRTLAQTLRSHETEILRRTLDPPGVAALADLEELYSTKVDLDRHHALQSLLRGWLVLHLPAAILLLGLVALHVVFVLYY